MSASFRVRYTVPPFRTPRPPGDVKTTDFQAELDKIPELLPANAYIMEIEDLTSGENVHWTRWPKSYRPGFGG